MKQASDVAILRSPGQAGSVTETDEASTLGGEQKNTTVDKSNLRDLPTADEIADRDFGAHRPKLSPFTILIGLIVFASFGVWVYAYSGSADRPPPDVLETDTFAKQAEPICALALEDIEEIPDASLAESAVERSEQLRQATNRFRTMITDLEDLTVPGESTRDAELREEWLTNWGILLDDRIRYADELLVDEDARFLVTDIGVSESPERRLGRFAVVNGMESCGTPGDAG